MPGRVMARTVPEWIGKNDDDVPPPRVRLRVFEQNRGQCALCHRRISPGEYWQCDHTIALCNGGKNAESNLRPACRNCCYAKTAEDVAEKAKIGRKRSKHLGISKSKGRPMPGSRASGWKRRMDGSVERRT